MTKNQIVAERIIEFEKGDFIENLQITSSQDSLITEKDWQTFADNSLIYTNGDDLYQFAEENPVVRYVCNNSPEFNLNAFIDNITVSIVLHGKKISLSTGRVTEEHIDRYVVAYYEDTLGRRYEVPQYDIMRLLLKKPNLVVSSEGILIFFTHDKILATIDCCHYSWINIDKKHSIIEDITVSKDHCDIYLSDTEKKNDMDEPIKYKYKLKFDNIIISDRNSNIINPIIIEF